jgi:hypothetical protein
MVKEAVLYRLKPVAELNLPPQDVEIGLVMIAK